MECRGRLLNVLLSPCLFQVLWNAALPWAEGSQRRYAPSRHGKKQSVFKFTYFCINSMLAI